jgi:hypothetical protein
MEDNRIYQIYTLETSKNPIHYFDRFVSELLPDAEENKEKKLLENFVSDLTKATRANGKLL